MSNTTYSLIGTYKQKDLKSLSTWFIILASIKICWIFLYSKAIYLLSTSSAGDELYKNGFYILMISLSVIVFLVIFELFIWNKLRRSLVASEKFNYYFSILFILFILSLIAISSATYGLYSPILKIYELGITLNGIK